MKKIMNLACLFLLLLFVSTSCQGQSNEQSLITDIDLTQMETFNSTKHGISFGVPAGLQVVEGVATLIVDPDPYATYSLDEPHYNIYTMRRNVDLGIRGLLFPRSATQIARIIQNPSLNFNDYSTAPITSVTVSGREGAFFIEKPSQISPILQHYVIVIELDSNEAVVLSASAPEELSGLMRSTLNAMALTARPIE